MNIETIIDFVITITLVILVADLHSKAINTRYFTTDMIQLAYAVALSKNLIDLEELNITFLEIQRIHKKRVPKKIYQRAIDQVEKLMIRRINLINANDK